MAAFARYEELRKQIDALVAENEELKQLVLLLRENQELKSVLRNQYNENISLPRFESSRRDNQEPLLNQMYFDNSSWPPSPPPSAGAVVRYQAPLRLALQYQQQQDYQSADQRSYLPCLVPYSRTAPAEDFLPLSYAQPDSSLGSSATGSSDMPQGFCFECPIPWHPHLPPNASTDNSISSGSVKSGAIPQGSSPVLPTDGSLSSPQQPLDAASAFAALSAQSDPSAAGSAFQQMGIAATGRVTFQPSAQFVAVPGSFQPMVLQNPAPFVLQPPPLGGKAKAVPPSEVSPPPAALPATQFPFPSPLPAMPPPQVPPQTEVPLEPQKPPGVKPKEHRRPSKQDTTTKKSSSETKPKESKQVCMERIVGEIAFQLDRRILSSVFPDRVRLYGFTVRNIPEKVMQHGNDPYSPLSTDQSAAIMERYNDIMNRLKPLGYDANVHPRLTERIVNTFGILRERPEMTGPEAASYNDIQYLQNVVNSTAPPDMLSDCLLLLNCLYQLSGDDGKPLFIW